MIWKLLSVIVINFALFIGTPFLLGWVSGHAWLILLLAATGVSMKTVIGDIINGKVEYHKHGFDFCLATMGASLAGLAVQLTKSENLYPGFSTHFGISSGDAGQAVMILVVIFALSCLFTLLTGLISKAIGQRSTQYKDALSMINFFIGVMFLGFNILILVSK